MEATTETRPVKPRLENTLPGRKPKGFTARPNYFVDGDYVTYYLQDERCYAERVDELLTIYRSMDTNKFVGCKIKGVKRLLKQLGNFGVAIKNEHGQLMLGMLFLAAMSIYPSNRQPYEEAGRLAGKAVIDSAELRLAA